MASQGLTTLLIGVEITNVGRLPASVHSAAAKTEFGVSVEELSLAVNPQSGVRLEPHSSVTWWVQWQSVQTAASVWALSHPEWNRAQKVRMVVRPAVGKHIETKESIPLRP